MRYLTKSRFNTAITCPTKLTYLDDPTFANADADNEFLKALAEGGHQVGAFAKCLFPDGIEVDAVGHDAQVEQTSSLLSRDEVVIFEAAIRVGRLFVRVDLLRKHGTTIELYEVKAKSFDSREGDGQIVGKRGGLSSEFKPYLYDVAFQRHVLRAAFPDATISSYLVMPNKAALCPEPLLAQRLRIRRTGTRQVEIDVDPSLRDGVLARQLLYVLPVDRFLDMLTSEELEAGGYHWAFADGIAELEGRIEGPFFEPRVGSHCKSCEYRTTTTEIQQGLRDGRLVCWGGHFRLRAAEFAHGTVFDLNNFRGAQAVIGAGKILLPHLETEDVKFKPEAGKISSSHRQWLQCEESRGLVARPVSVTDSLAAKLAAVSYPLHFIDFETATPAMPFHAGRRPYEQLLFQFSHHRLDRDGQVAHMTQHLDGRPGAFPNFDTVRALSLALGADQGSVIHWWHHERTVLGKVREQLLAFADPPEDRDQLVAFIDTLVGVDGGRGVWWIWVCTLLIRSCSCPARKEAARSRRCFPR